MTVCFAYHRAILLCSLITDLIILNHNRLVSLVNSLCSKSYSLHASKHYAGCFCLWVVLLISTRFIVCYLRESFCNNRAAMFCNCCIFVSRLQDANPVLYVYVYKTYGTFRVYKCCYSNFKNC